MDEDRRPVLRDQPHRGTLTCRWEQAGSRGGGGKQAESAEREKGVLHAQGIAHSRAARQWPFWLDPQSNQIRTAVPLAETISIDPVSPITS